MTAMARRATSRHVAPVPEFAETFSNWRESLPGNGRPAVNDADSVSTSTATMPSSLL